MEIAGHYETGKRNDPVFIIVCEYVVEYECSEDFDLNSETASLFASRVATPLVYSYLRTKVQQTSLEMGMEPIILPLYREFESQEVVEETSVVEDKPKKKISKKKSAK